MARLNPTHHSILVRYVDGAAIGIAAAVSVPVLAVGAFFLQGVVAAAIGVAALAGGLFSLWHYVIEPRVSPRCRLIVGEIGVGLAIIGAIPVLALVIVSLGGAVAIVVPGAIVAMVLIGVWRIIAAARHIVFAKR